MSVTVSRWQQCWKKKRKKSCWYGLFYSWQVLLLFILFECNWVQTSCVAFTHTRIRLSTKAQTLMLVFTWTLSHDANHYSLLCIHISFGDLDQFPRWQLKVWTNNIVFHLLSMWVDWTFAFNFACFFLLICWWVFVFLLQRTVSVVQRCMSVQQKNSHKHSL